MVAGPARGQLIDITLHLQRPRPNAFDRLDFLGGMLHGLLRSVWPRGTKNRPAGWQAPEFRLLPPSASTAEAPRWLNPQGCLSLSVLWHEHAGLSASDAARALQELRVLKVDAESYRLARIETAVGAWQLPWPAGSLPQDIPKLGLEINWLTPVHLASGARVASGQGDRPPYLFRILRSLQKRAEALEPEWAAAWHIGSPEWRDAIETVRRASHPAAVGPHDVQPFEWRYGSRTKAAPILRRGLIGVQRFVVPRHPSVAALLHAGQWLGAGEGSSFGCGLYTAKWSIGTDQSSGLSSPSDIRRTNSAQSHRP